MVPVNEIVIPKVVHPGWEMAEDQNPFIFVQTKVIFWIIQKVEQRSTWNRPQVEYT